MKRFCSSIAKPISENIISDAKPFSAMPGPKGIFGIGSFYQYMKIFGKKYDLFTLHVNGQKNYEEYGPIVHERIAPGINLVHIFDPDDIQKMYSYDSPSNLPSRISHLPVLKYRLSRPEIYRTAGLIPTNGEDWWQVRSEAQKDISKTKIVRTTLQAVDRSAKDFIALLPHILDDKMILEDTTSELVRLFFEMVGEISFGEKFDCLSLESRAANTLSSKMAHAIRIFNETTMKLDRGFMWKYFDTKLYKQFCEAHETFEKLWLDIYKKKLAKGDGFQGDSMVDHLLRRKELDTKDVNSIAIDMIIAGIDTTSNNTSMFLYCAAKNPEVQEKLYEEAKRVLPSKDDDITTSILNSEVPYFRAAMKENFRLNPAAVGVGRMSNKEMVLGGYKIPKNTILVTGNMVACRLEKNFPEPLKFKPERWLRSLKHENNIHPYLVLPFGHGMRSCLARRFAEQNILVALLRIFRNYKVEWHGVPEQDVLTKMLNQAKYKTTLKFIPREE